MSVRTTKAQLVESLWREQQRVGSMLSAQDRRDLDDCRDKVRTLERRISSRPVRVDRRASDGGTK